MTWRRVAAVLATVFLAFGVLVVARWQPLVGLDRRVDLDAHALVLAHRSLLSAARVVTHAGDPLALTLAAVAVAMGLAHSGRRPAAGYVLVARAAAVVVGFVAKEVVRRHRPLLAHPVATAVGFSFPSGHALGSAAFYASVAVVARRSVPAAVCAAVAVVIPVAVATTRVLLGVHFPSDVAAGLALGWAVAVAAEPATRVALTWPATRR